jgi:ABC-type antimicrobial peptide transport system permease subunit
VRTAVAPSSITAAVRAQIAAVDPDQPVTKVRTVDDLMDSSRSQPRFTMLLLGVFSATALVLAVIGIYGVLSYSVALRRKEFGIRLALGAEHADILRLVVRQGFILTIAGIAIGLMASLLLTRLMSTMLYKVSAYDLTTFVLTPLVFLGIALLASYLPARRATRVDPLEAIR